MMILLGLAAGAQPAAAMFTGVEEIAETSSPSSANKGATATCPAGKLVMGGGAEVSPPDGRVLISAIRPSTTLTSVYVTAYEDEAGTAGDWTVTAYAICAPAPAGLQLVKATSASSSVSKSATAACPTGKKVLGAGGEVAGARGQLLINAVTPSSDLANVRVSAFEDETGTTATWTVTAYAICGSPAQPVVRRNRVSGFSSGSPRSISRPCEAGEVAVGMGGAANGAGNQLVLQAITPTIEPTVVAAEDRTGYAGTWTPEAFAICGAELLDTWQRTGGFSGEHQALETKCPGTGTVALGTAAGTDRGRGEVWLGTFGPQDTQLPSTVVGWGTETERAAEITAHAFCAAPLPGFELHDTTLPEDRPDDPIKTAVATCPAGKKALSGGSAFYFNANDPHIMLQQVVPSSTLASVHVNAVETEAGTTSDWEPWATAVCATPPPGLVRVSQATTPDSAESKRVAVSCPAGKHVVGAGASVTPQIGQVALDDILSDEGMTTVTAEAFEDLNGYPGNWNLIAYAVCVTR
jgi:hypothetical protein